VPRLRDMRRRNKRSVPHASPFVARDISPLAKPDLGLRR
jgi:hypothetical protein